MTVKELIEKLKTFDPKMEVAYRCYSDYQRMEVEDIDVQELVDHGSGSYLMSVPTYPSGHKGIQIGYPKDKIKPFVCFPGN